MSTSADLDPFGRPLSGFRRIGFAAAPIAAKIAAFLDPDPGTTDEADSSTLSNRQANALARLDEAAARCPVDDSRSRWIGLHTDKTLLFGLGCDVAPDQRWRAIVSRAYARADAVAWGEAESRDDGRYLAEKAKKIARCRDSLSELVCDTRFLDTIGRHRAGGIDYNDWIDDLGRAVTTLKRFEKRARGSAAHLNPTGRPRVIARTHFVLRLAAAHAVLTGEAPPFDGGNDEDDHDLHGARKRSENRRWHDLIKAALDVAGISGRGQINSILSHAATIAGRADVDRIDEFAEMQPSDLRSIEAGSWPGTGLEIDVGIARPPTAREEAYAHPGTWFVGLGGLSRSDE